MIWQVSNRASPQAVRIADRHYSRQKVGSPQFVPPGSCFVLFGYGCTAIWTTSHPLPQYVKHRWPGAWICSCFRRESGIKASDMIRQAVAATRWKWPAVPDLGMVTFIDREKVRPIRKRGKDVWGYTYMLAGFEPDGETEGGLLAFRLKPERMPPPEMPLGETGELFT